MKTHTKRVLLISLVCCLLTACLGLSALATGGTADATLSSLEVSPGTLTPAFSSNVYEYQVEVGADCDKLLVSGKTTDSGAKMVIAGNDGLKAGSNAVIVNVTAADGVTKAKYTITVIRGSDAFRDKQAGETGFYVTYLLLLSLLFTGFQEAVSSAETVMNQVTAFMGALVPAFTLSVAASGKPLTAVFSYEFILICANAAQWCFRMIFLPGIQIFAVVSLVGQISKEEMLGKLQELLELVLGWGMKALMGVILGYGAIQSLVLPLADSLKTGAVTRILSAIPGIGNSAGAAAGLVAGMANLIKNSMGAAALAALLFLAVIPLLKLLVLALLYQGAAALVQPAADERVTECLSSMARGMLLLFKLTGGTVCLFFLSVALVCGFTSTGL